MNLLLEKSIWNQEERYAFKKTIIREYLKSVLGFNKAVYTADKQYILQSIANIIVFMVSDESKFITGPNIVVDGGRTFGMKGTE